jgi:hypothetical protein
MRGKGVEYISLRDKMRWVLGNSGKPVTLETLSLTKFSKHVFQGEGNSRFSEAWNLWSLEFANVRSSGILIRWRNGVTNMRKPGVSSCRWPELRRKANSGIYWRPNSGVSREDIHEPGEKQSQSCCPKKSGFRVWTSGRFVNMLDEKTFLYAFTLGIFSEPEGVFSM